MGCLLQLVTACSVVQLVLLVQPYNNDARCLEGAGQSGKEGKSEGRGGRAGGGLQFCRPVCCAIGRMSELVRACIKE